MTDPRRYVTHFVSSNKRIYFLHTHIHISLMIVGLTHPFASLFCFILELINSSFLLQVVSLFVNVTLRYTMTNPAANSTSGQTAVSRKAYLATSLRLKIVRDVAFLAMSSSNGGYYALVIILIVLAVVAMVICAYRWYVKGPPAPGLKAKSLSTERTGMCSPMGRMAANLFERDKAVVPRNVHLDPIDPEGPCSSTSPHVLSCITAVADVETDTDTDEAKLHAQGHRHRDDPERKSMSLSSDLVCDFDGHADDEDDGTLPLSPHLHATSSVIRSVVTSRNK